MPTILETSVVTKFNDDTQAKLTILYCACEIYIISHINNKVPLTQVLVVTAYVHSWQQTLFMKNICDVTRRVTENDDRMSNLALECHDHKSVLSFLPIRK